MNSQECPADVELKTCTKCGEAKPLKCFGTRKRESGVRYFSRCKSCKSMIDAENYMKCREKRLKQCAERRKRCKAEIADYMREYYQRNRESIIAKTKAYQNRPDRKQADSDRQMHRYLSNREQIRKKQQERSQTPEAKAASKRIYQRHYSQNKAYYVAKGATRRAMRIQATPPWVTLKEIQPFYELAKRLTQETGTKHVVDHIIPLKHSAVCGLHVPDNLQVITESENLSKFNKFNA